MNSEKWYNKKTKNNYIKSLGTEGLEHVASFTLLKISAEEREKGEDVYNMSFKDIEDVLYSLSPSSELSSYHNLLRIEDYINWAIKEKLSIHEISPLSIIINRSEYSKKFVSYYKRTIFSKEQLNIMMNELVNKTDRMVLLALFEGIRGVDYTEILNLSMKNLERVNGIYRVILTDKDGTKRPLTISSELADLMWESDNERFYVNKNGLSKSEKASMTMYESSVGILKKTVRGGIKKDLDGSYIQRKFSLFKEVFNMRFLTPRQVINSGIMHYAHMLYQKYGEIGILQYDMIGDKFNVSMVEKDGYVYRNTTIIRRVLRMPEFEELYGYKIID